MFSAQRNGGVDDGVTLNAGATAFAYTVPAGFTGWDLTPVSAGGTPGSLMMMGVGM
jgi:hypothetical protein